jgi:uncharacterized protein (DUF885 family)
MRRFGMIAAFFGMLLGSAALFGGERDAQWNALVDEYLEKSFLPRNPSTATFLGVHQYDSEIEDYSKSGRDADIRALHEYEKRLEEFSPAGLNEVNAADRLILLGAIRSELLSLEKIRPLEKNPDVYSSVATGTIYLLMIRKFAPPEDRLRSVIARERKIPGILDDAQRNLDNPARISTDIALEQLPGMAGFFEKDVPLAFTDVKDAALNAEFQSTNVAVIAALRKYETWLKTDLLPRSKGDFRIGAENFSKKLQYEDMVDTPLERLLAVGMADLRKNQEEFQRVAREINPNKKATEVLADLEAMHPPPDKLMETFRGTFDGLIAFIQQKYIITIPPGPKPILQETPPFERATTTASMDTPGPFETKATEAFFHVTLPAPGDSPEDVASLMSAFNIGTIFSTSTHETYPGHYIQYLWTPRAPSKLRKIFSANTNGEGWAHYCEQMMLEEGYAQPGVGAKDALEAKYIHLGQLQDALLRDARFVVGIRMHTGTMSLEEAQAFFVKEGYQAAKIASIETKRGTSDPTYLYYTLGKLQILKLREDYKKKMGADFSLGKFHDAFMGQGFPPIAVVRKALLGDDSPVL